MKRIRLKQLSALAAMEMSTGWLAGAAVLAGCSALQGWNFARELALEKQQIAQWNTFPDGFFICLQHSGFGSILNGGWGILFLFLLLRSLWRSVGSRSPRQFWGRLPLSAFEKAAAAAWANFVWLSGFWGVQLLTVLGCWLAYSRQLPLRQYGELSWTVLQSPFLRQWFPLARPVQLAGVLLALLAASILCAGLERGGRGRIRPLDPLDVGCLITLAILGWILARMARWETAFLWVAVVILLALCAGAYIALCLFMENPIQEEP